MHKPRAASDRGNTCIVYGSEGFEEGYGIRTGLRQLGLGLTECIAVMTKIPFSFHLCDRCVF